LSLQLGIADAAGTDPIKSSFRANRLAEMSDDASYFFLSEARVGCHVAAFWLGAAAMDLIFSFLGFLASRLLLC
jgi:hypothetical protein